MPKPGLTNITITLSQHTSRTIKGKDAKQAKVGEVTGTAKVTKR